MASNPPDPPAPSSALPPTVPLQALRFSGDELLAAASEARAASRNPSGLAHQPNDRTRELVRVWAEVGTANHIIAMELGIDARTLDKHYAEELRDAEARGFARVSQSMYAKALAGDTTAGIFILKARGKRFNWIDKEDDKPSVIVQLDVVKSITAAMHALKSGKPIDPALLAPSAAIPASQAIVEATGSTSGPLPIDDGSDLI